MNGFFPVANRNLAYSYRQGKKPLGFFWLSGYRSDMQGKKAQFVDNFAAEEGYSCLRFDYSAHGQSEGDFSEGTLSQWLTEALAFYQKFCQTIPQIVIGSSMGGWLALRLYQELAKQDQTPAALVLLAPAPDFTQTLIEPRLSNLQKQALDQEGYFSEPSPYSEEGTVFYKKLIDDGKKHLILNKPLDITSPLFIIQGQKDESVPYAHVLRLVELLPHNNVYFTMVMDGDHSLSRPQDLALLARILKAAISEVEQQL